MNVSGLIKDARGTLVRNAPQILTGAAVAGVVVTTALAIQATPLAYERVRAERELNNGEELSKAVVFHTVWKLYIPTALMATATIACVIGANSEQMRRTAAIAAAYSLAEKASGEFQEKVVEAFGEDATWDVKEKIMQDHLDAKPIEHERIFTGNGGGDLFYDSMSGRYFTSDIETVRGVQNDLNHQLINDVFVDLNSLYALLGLEDIKLGHDLGWNSDKDLIELGFGARIASNGQPCIVLEYLVDPKLDYFRSI